MVDPVNTTLPQRIVKIAGIQSYSKEDLDALCVNILYGYGDLLKRLSLVS